jgi:DtxR family Mn-dependent transcriptional regulator
MTVNHLSERIPNRSATVERYLETIYCIAGEGDIVRPSRLVAWMSVSAPTVSDALHRLERDGWVTIASDRSVKLTAVGFDAASSIVKRHRVLERWLTDVLKFDWATADEEADRLSSSCSDEVIDRLDEAMGRPTTCPHGNPIPGRSPAYGALRTLLDVVEGSVVTVRRISEVAEHEARPLLRTLGEHGVGEGSQVLVASNDPANDVLLLSCGDEEFSLARTTAKVIWVE